MTTTFRRLTALTLSAALLSGCVTTRESRIGADDNSDACRTHLVALDSTGNHYAEDMVRGAAIGAAGGAAIGALAGLATGGRGSNIAAGAAIGAVAGGALGAAGGYLRARQQQAADQSQLRLAVAGDLSAENAQLDRTQLAFNQLMDCRFGTAQRIREDLRAGRLTRPQAEQAMANLRSRTQRDLEIARAMNARIAERGAEFDTAIEHVAPGASQEARSATASRTVPAQARGTVSLKLRPDPAAPEVARLDQRERVTLRPASNGFALVETGTGLRGYAPAQSFPEARTLRSAPAPAAARDGDVRSLAASNVARRDNFAESVGNAERLAQGQGFELAG
jgi:outer membrane lipoprotein SlyB